MEKIKVFLVDDEAIILKGLETTYSWEKMGAVVVGTSRNPGKAVAEILEKQPDIVITDIRMKQMTGLELIQEVNRQAKKKCLWIVISAYRDFEYAQKACELGAFTYLLKPIEDSRLEEAVCGAAKTIRQTNKSRKILQDYEHFIENNRKVFENYMISKFSGDQIDEEEIRTANCSHYILVLFVAVLDIVVMYSDMEVTLTLNRVMTYVILFVAFRNILELAALRYYDRQL